LISFSFTELIIDRRSPGAGAINKHVAIACAAVSSKPKRQLLSKKMI
jgi:hypothetical protein